MILRWNLKQYPVPWKQNGIDIRYSEERGAGYPPVAVPGGAEI